MFYYLTLSKDSHYLLILHQRFVSVKVAYYLFLAVNLETSFLQTHLKPAEGSTEKF
jgi:hypothetical protein